MKPEVKVHACRTELLEAPNSKLLITSVGEDLSEISFCSSSASGGFTILCNSFDFFNFLDELLVA